MSDDDVLAIKELEAARFAALQAGDIEDFARLCSPQLRYVHSSGVVDVGREYLDKLDDGYYVYSHITHGADQIDVRGDVALVYGWMKCDVLVDGTPKKLDNLFLAVWERSGDTWLFLASQPTAVPQG